MCSVATRGFDPNSKYFPLHKFLLEHERHAAGFSMSFSKIEVILGISLPPGARSNRSWWGNGTWGHSQSRSWLLAGWRAVNVDVNGEIVEFVLNEVSPLPGG
jgi:hypothetical protein